MLSPDLQRIQHIYDYCTDTPALKLFCEEQLAKT